MPVSPEPSSRAREQFQLYLIKPSHYDDEGYVIQWLRSDLPSNTMAVLNGIILDCINRRVLGDQVDIATFPVDEIHTRVRPDRIIRSINHNAGKALVVLAGVQSNQFPRAVDIARPFVAANIPVCIGGFHVSGSLAMLPETPPEIQQAMDLGISIFTGDSTKGLINNFTNAVDIFFSHVPQKEFHSRSLSSHWLFLYLLPITILNFTSSHLV